MAYPHFQPAQTNALRILNKRHTESDRGQRWTPVKPSRRSGWIASVWELAHRFGNRTTIHGINRLLGEGSGRYERMFWLLTVTAALLGAIYVCLILSDRFKEGKFDTVVDSTRAPVYRIYFPVITICNMNRLNWQRLEEAQRKFLPRESTQQQRELFARIIGGYDVVAFGHFEQFANLQSEPTAELDFVNFTMVADFMSWRCEEFLTECLWRHVNMDCCEIFFKRRTEKGLCWAFNTIETDEGRRKQQTDSMYPWHTANAGVGSGLNVRVLINPEKHFPNNTLEKGLMVMVSEPNVWYKDPFDVAANTQTMVEIEPVIFFYDNDTRTISSEQRQCVFNDEQNSDDFKSLQGFIYMIENCNAECHQEYLMRYCNCSMDLFYPPGKYPPCKAKDLLCLSKNNEYFMYSHQSGEEEYVTSYFEGMVCPCFRNCYSLNYVTDVRPSFLSDEVRGNLSYVDLDVHFRFETMMVYRTSLIFGWVDLMVAFGGIAGLFLGCSLISAMELAYLALIEMPTFVFGKCKRQRQNHPQQQQQEILQQQQQRPGLTSNSVHNFGLTNRVLATQRNNQGYFVINGGGSHGSGNHNNFNSSTNNYNNSTNNYNNPNKNTININDHMQQMRWQLQKKNRQHLQGI